MMEKSQRQWFSCYGGRKQSRQAHVYDPLINQTNDRGMSEDEQYITNASVFAQPTVLPWRSKRSMVALTVANVVLFCLSAVVIVVCAIDKLQTPKNIHWKRANAYSPIVDSIDIPLALHRMQGTLLDQDHDIYRQPPSPAVDAAWDDLSEHGISYVTSGEARRMGWDISVMPNLPEVFGLGKDKYAGETDMLHKIHCLNMVRKDVYFDYYWGSMYPDGKSSELHQIHTSHCIYILLQALMCDANTDLIPHVYLEDYPYPVPDFEINRKCGNFEGVRRWMQANSVDFNETTRKVLEKPPGHKARPISSEFRRVFEIDEP